jgi:elongation factor Ts
MNENLVKLRKETGAGLSSCKKALLDSSGDYEKAKDLLAQRGLKVISDRGDRATNNGCVVVCVTSTFSAMLSIKCETDFVAKGDGFVNLVEDILYDLVTDKVEDIKEPKVAKMIEEKISKYAVAVGEKIEVGNYHFISGNNVYLYNHRHNNTLCVLCQLNKKSDEVGHAMAMQIAAMNPLSIDMDDLDVGLKNREIGNILEKTRAEFKNKTEDELYNISKGRMIKYYKEVCLMKQPSIIDLKTSVEDYAKGIDKEAKVLDFKRLTI